MANGQENPYADLVPPGQEDPFAGLAPPGTLPEPKGRIAPGIRLIQGITGPLSKLLGGPGVNPAGRLERRIAEEVPSPAKDALEAMFASLGKGSALGARIGENLEDITETLEERTPRPEFEPLEFGGVRELLGSVGRNLRPLAAEAIEFAPALIGAEVTIRSAFPALAAKAPAGASLLARTGQRARRGGVLGEAFALTSGEAVENPTARSSKAHSHCNKPKTAILRQHRRRSPPAAIPGAHR